MYFLLVAVVMLVSAFTQTLTGFGSALVSMSILPSVLGILSPRRWSRSWPLRWNRSC